MSLFMNRVATSNKWRYRSSISSALFGLLVILIPFSSFYNPELLKKLPSMTYVE